MTDEVAAVEETPVDDRAAMQAVWDANHGDDRPRDEHGRFAAAEPAVSEEAEAPEPPEEPEATEQPEDAPEPPGHLPRAVKEVWASLDETARDAISSSQDEMARKLGDATRVQRAAQPVYDVIVKAAQEMPTLAGMTPEDIAKDVFDLARWGNALNTDPRGTLLSIAREKGIDLTGAEPTEAPQQTSADHQAAQLQTRIDQLERQLRQVADPNAIQSQIQTTMETARIEAEIGAFASQKPEWGVLEPHIQARIPSMMDENPHLSPMEVLSYTYDTVAKELLNPLRSAAAEHATKARKAEAAHAAASINVEPESAGSAAPKSEWEVAKEIWERNHG